MNNSVYAAHFILNTEHSVIKITMSIQLYLQDLDYVQIDKPKS